MKNYWKLTGSIIFLATVALFISCSSKPSSGDGQRIVQQQIEKYSHGRIKLVSFEKVNGQEAEMLGVKIYNLECDCVIEFLEDCKWIPPYGTAKLVKSQGFWEKFDDDLKNVATQNRPVKKGEKAKIKGRIVFEKTEKGWRAAKF